MIKYYEDWKKLECKKDLGGEEALEAVKQEGRTLRYVHNQTPEICLAAVGQNGYVLEYVYNQTPEICLAAVMQDGYALQYVQNQTPKICLAAVEQDIDALQYVEERIFFEEMPKECVQELGSQCEETPMKDVTKPDYYGKLDVITFCTENNIPFCEGNVIKYVVRYAKKNGLEDLKKAREYLDRLIKRCENES